MHKNIKRKLRKYLYSGSFTKSAQISILKKKYNNVNFFFLKKLFMTYLN